MLAQVFASSEMESLPSAEAMSFACLFLGNMCASFSHANVMFCVFLNYNFRCKLQLFAIQATEYGLLAILMALISSSADDFQFNDLAIEHMQVCVTDPKALEGLLGREHFAHPKGSAVLQVLAILINVWRVC